MRALFIILNVTLFFGSSFFVLASEPASQHAVTEVTEQASHGTDMSPLFFIIIALFMGIIIRHWFKKSPVPYTVMLLLLGIVIGVLNRVDILHFSSLIQNSVSWAGNIDPHLILYVFLPTLIFEAAFAMDVHTFKKNFTNSLILAVPGIIVALVITAFMCMLIVWSGWGLSQWNWIVALLFGTLISATDPVAVVSLLKELGTSKKLTILVDSESLLNDGTAIVIFMVFFYMLTGQVSDNPILIEMLRVVLGGTLMGIIIGWIVNFLLKQVFNDALFEITLIVAAAYLTFFVNENLLHVSGVLGLVSYGLLMAGVGRTRISPEVSHFLHEFWELAAFIANTLIFIIVGVVIAQKSVFSANDFLILLVIFVIINIARGVMLLLFYPIMRKTGYGVEKRELFVLWYGALRGAVGLALALIFASTPGIPEEIRNQIVFFTAGIVMLTALINATTIGYFIDKFGFTKISRAKALVIENNYNYLKKSSESAIDKLKQDRFMAGADWARVNAYMPVKPTYDLDESVNISPLVEARKRILHKEKASYWEQFEEGLLSKESVMELSASLDVIIDFEGNSSLSDRKDIEYLWKMPTFLNLLQNVPLPVVQRFAKLKFFEKLGMGYDCARAFVAAQDECLKLLKGFAITATETDKEFVLTDGDLETLEKEIYENRIQGLTFIRNLKESFPAVYHQIETRQAIRSLLNHQRGQLVKLEQQHRLDHDEAERMNHHIEEQMALLYSKVTINSENEFDSKSLKHIKWLSLLPNEVFKRVINAFEAKLFSVDEVIVRNNKNGDDLFIILQGSVKIMTDNMVKDILGQGDVIGEMSLLTGFRRNASAIAISPTTTLRLSANKFSKLVHDHPILEDVLWEIAGKRLVVNEIDLFTNKKDLPYAEIKQWVDQGHVKKIIEGEELQLINDDVLLLSGSLLRTDDLNTNVNAIAILPQGHYKAKSIARIFVKS